MMAVTIALAKFSDRAAVAAFLARALYPRWVGVVR